MKEVDANQGADIAVVVPCYRSSDSIDVLARRLVGAMHDSGYGFELILVDDASPDSRTWETLVSLKSRFGKQIKCYRLARNVGQHNAILCGIAQISESVKCVVTMDDDLQQLPEDVPRLLRAIDGGADMAVGAYPRKKHGVWKNLSGRLIDATLRRIFSLPSTFQLTSFRAFRRYVADEVVENRSRYTYLTAALLSVTRHQVNVSVAHEERREGRSGYSLIRSLELAASLYLTYSRVPLYLVMCLFFLSMSITGSITLWALLRYMSAHGLPMGWTSLMVMIGICSTFNLAATAVVALLATRSHRQSVGAYGHWRISDNG